MSKPILGRGLGTLLRGDKVAGTETTIPEAQEPPSTGAGFKTLVRGTADVVTPAHSTRKSSKPAIPPAYFFAADVLLIGLALLIGFKDPGAMSWKQMLFCIFVVILGCLCGLAGVLVGQ